jgi:ferredoxin-NADP reductase
VSVVADLTLTVAQRTEAASGVVHLVLASVDGEALPAWEPGAHVDVVLTPTLVRQYSLCGDPTDGQRWEVAVLREPSGQGSAFVHESLSLGRPVRVRGPRNHFPLQPADDYVFIAGGIGITPILPMLAAATAAGASWRLVYGGRTRESMAFADALTKRYRGQVELVPQDTCGLIDLDALLGKPSPGTLVYCCGPSPLLDAVTDRMAHWPAGSLHLERFTAVKTEPATEPVVQARTSFEVELSQSGKVITVSPDESILEAVEREGISALFSCREGNCGTCETGVLKGVPEHHDEVLTDSEHEANDVMMICVSRAVSPRLVLDL